MFLSIHCIRPLNFVSHFWGALQKTETGLASFTAEMTLREWRGGGMERYRK
jgi:hypothetical protein